MEADAWLTRNSMQLPAHPGFVQDGRFHRCAYKLDHWYDMIWMDKEIGSPDVPQQPVRFGQLP
ncbi:GNAT family N-acetyltransferase [uncultured Megasphaera sp.]|uniref:GNAT family N-acetyltransferase n=1 Tax=uncultured Megasphaera sp. TaxID=165188 RepID=UPI000C7CF4E5|nr:GNAT family N-acetyltransferase [uncultured Megasphaera sp.]